MTVEARIALESFLASIDPDARKARHAWRSLTYLGQCIAAHHDLLRAEVHDGVAITLVMLLWRVWHLEAAVIASQDPILQLL